MTEEEKKALLERYAGMRQSTDEERARWEWAHIRAAPKTKEQELEEARLARAMPVFLDDGTGTKGSSDVSHK